MEPIFIISGIMAAISVGGIGIALLFVATGKIKS
jgi:hypothetical protein